MHFAVESAIDLNDISIFVEVKQIDLDENFQKTGDIRVAHRVIGSHIRSKISESKGQVQVGAKFGAPSILVIFNNLDPLEIFGTEEHDFLIAMFGELTLTKQGKNFTGYYHGRNSSLREEYNTSFSAVGYLKRGTDKPTLKLYLNPFAKNEINFESIPICIETIKIEISFQVG